MNFKTQNLQSLNLKATQKKSDKEMGMYEIPSMDTANRSDRNLKFFTGTHIQKTNDDSNMNVLNIKE